MANIEVADLETGVPSKKRSIGPLEEREGAGGSSTPPGEKAPRVAVAGARSALLLHRKVVEV